MTASVSQNIEKAAVETEVYAALIFIQLVFGGFHVFGKYVVGFVHPLALGGIRVIFAAPLLFAVAYAVDKKLPALKDMPYLALLGLLGVFFNQILYVVGLKYTTATNAGILMASIPVFTVGVAALLGIEALNRRRFFGVFLAVAGALVMLDITRFSLKEDHIFGNFLQLLNCLSYGTFLALQRPILKRLPPLTVIAWAFIFGGLGIAGISLPYLRETDFSQISGTVYLGIAYIVILPTTINYALNTWAIKRSSPALVATFTTLQPLTAALLATLFLSETLGPREAVGFALIVSGLFTVSRFKNNRHKKTPA